MLLVGPNIMMGCSACLAFVSQWAPSSEKIEVLLHTIVFQFLIHVCYILFFIAVKRKRYACLLLPPAMLLSSSLASHGDVLVADGWSSGRQWARMAGAQVRMTYVRGDKHATGGGCDGDG
jgi:hypothetical protein